MAGAPAQNCGGAARLAEQGEERAELGEERAELGEEKAELGTNPMTPIIHRQR